MPPALVKSLNRLPSSSLIDLALKWLQKSSQCTPYLQSNRSLNESEEEDYLFTPAENVDSLRKIYDNLRSETKDKSHIIDRILDGDWRRGLSLQQHAMIDFACLEHSDTALRWSALKLTPLENEQSLPKGFEERPTKRRKLTSTPSHPTISPSSFIASLESHVSPLVKAHYHLHRLPAPHKLSIVRIHISSRSAFTPTPANVPRSARSATDSGRIVYIALPEGCPYVYISISGNIPTAKPPGQKSTGKTQAKSDMASMKRIILEAIPKALSRPQERWALEGTKLTTRSLKAMCELRGGGKPGTAGGVYSHLTEETQTPIAVEAKPQTRRVSQNDEGEEVAVLKHKTDHRFGTIRGTHHAALDRFNVKIEDVMRPSGESRSMAEAASINLAFAGADVFLGLKSLADLGDDHVDLDKVPSWMTGELGVSVLTV